jgi:hypothetical protein
VKIAQIAYRDDVELNGKRLVEDGQEIRILVDSILERSVGEQLLHEASVDVGITVGGVARVASLRVVTSAIALMLDGKTLLPGIGYAGNDARRSDAIHIFTADVVLLVRERGTHRDEQRGDQIAGYRYSGK